MCVCVYVEGGGVCVCFVLVLYGANEAKDRDIFSDWDVRSWA